MIILHLFLFNLSIFPSEGSCVFSNKRCQRLFLTSPSEPRFLTVNEKYQSDYTDASRPRVVPISARGKYYVQVHLRESDDTPREGIAETYFSTKKELNNLRHYFSKPRVCSCKLLSFCLSRKLRATRKLKRG